MLPLYFCRTVRLDCPVFIWRHTMKEEKIKVLALLPMELPKEIELDNTLEAMQKFVDGNRASFSAVPYRIYERHY